MKPIRLFACLLLIGACALSSTFSWARESGQIDVVTVYPDRATVERLIEAQVRVGSGRLVIPDLPASVDAATLRISADGVDGLRLGHVETRRVRGADRVLPAARELEQRIEELERERRRAGYRVQALEMSLELLRSIARGRGEDAALAIEDWDRAAGILGERAGMIYVERLEIEDRISELDTELERLRGQLEDLGRQQRDQVEAVVAYQADSAGRARFRIAYTVPEAGWHPAYELRLDTEAARIELTQSARVRQVSGEDWSDAEVVLSLSRPALGGQLPALHPWFIDVQRPAPERAADAPEAMARVAVTGARIAEAEELMAAFEGGDFSAQYRVPGRVTVAGDNRQHRFRLAVHELDAELSARAVPRINQNAFLFARADWTGEGPLLPGTASLFQDGVRVGQTRLDAAAPGAELEIAFGIDDAIEIEYSLQRDTRGTDGLIRRQTRQEREFLIEVTNRHSRPMEIAVLDRMPVSRDERIQVSLTDNTDRPTERDLDDRPGILVWTHDYTPGQTRQIRFGYRATYPEGVEGISGW